MHPRAMAFEASMSSGGRDSEGIVTPEAVLLDVETAGFASRILAGLLDLTIQLVLFAIGIVIIGLIFARDTSSLQTTIAVLTFLILFVYPIALETWLRGRTPGKMALGIRAVTLDGAPIRLREATLRAMGGVVDLLLPPGGVTGALFVTFTPRHQRVGDLIAGTIVIRDPEKYVITPALWFSAPRGLEAYAETIDPTAITVEQYTVIRSFLTRGSRLSAPIRNSLALDLAHRLSARIRHTPPQYVPPEAFLICAMARYQRRNGPGKSASFSGMAPQQPGIPGAPGAANVTPGAWTPISRPL
jgi:uncharacterized RDD family membrane protein YckC